jgi:hypothetical protein
LLLFKLIFLEFFRIKDKEVKQFKATKLDIRDSQFYINKSLFSDKSILQISLLSDTNNRDHEFEKIQ